MYDKPYAEMMGTNNVNAGTHKVLPSLMICSNVSDVVLEMVRIITAIEVKVDTHVTIHVFQKDSVNN